MERKSVVSPSYLIEYYKKGHKFAQQKLDTKRKAPKQAPLQNKKLSKLVDDIFFGDGMIEFEESLNDYFGSSKADIPLIIKELEKHAADQKAEFGKQSEIGSLLADLRDLDKAARQFMKVFDKTTDRLSKVNVWKKVLGK